MSGEAVRHHWRAGSSFPVDAKNAVPGSGKSYGELYVEYAPAARRLALSMVSPDVADDIVAEAFARVLAAIRGGGGPDHAFRGYLLAAVRNVANDWIAARRRVTVIGDLDEEAGAWPTDRTGFSSGAEAQAEARAEARLIVRAFSRLPKRWRTVLWHLEVDGQAPAEVAPVFGLSANGVSALAMRAREGLRQAYLQEHIGTNIPAACRAYAEELGAGTRGRLSPRRRAAMQQHLKQCPRCRDLFAELSELNSKLGSVLAPIALAGTSAVLHPGRHALIRAGLSAHGRTLRWHPVTAAVGAAASVVVAGGMIFAVNVTPAPASPSHVTVRAANPAYAGQGPSAGSHSPSRRGGGGGGGGTPTGSGSSAGSGPLTGAGPSGGSGARATGGTVPVTSGTDPAGTSVTGAAGAVGTAAGSLTNAATAAATGATNAAVDTVSGVTGAASGVTGAASGVTGAASGVTGAASGATRAASGATGTASGVTGAASGAARAASGAARAASGAARAVSGAASAAVTGASGAASAVSTTSTTVTSAANAAASTTRSATKAVTGAVGTTGSTVVAATTGLAGTRR